MACEMCTYLLVVRPVFFLIVDRYSTFSFTGVHQCTKRTIHPSMHILDHSQGLLMFGETVLRLYSLYRMYSKRYLYVFTSIFSPDAIQISR